jgi:hypothetical protein
VGYWGWWGIARAWRAMRMQPLYEPHKLPKDYKYPSQDRHVEGEVSVDGGRAAWNRCNADAIVDRRNTLDSDAGRRLVVLWQPPQPNRHSNLCSLGATCTARR